VATEIGTVNEPGVTGPQIWSFGRTWYLLEGKKWFGEQASLDGPGLQVEGWSFGT